MLFLMSALMLSPCNLHADQAQYFYGDQGRLSAVADSTGNLAIYNYDAVGNLLGIQRFTPAGSGIGIFLLLLSGGGSGMQVTIQGYGFDPTPANNQVAFNGTPATVVSSTATTIVATVPSGMSTGAVTVTNTNGTGTSPQPFILLTPAISTIAPSLMPQGTKGGATITGQNLAQASAVTFTQSGLTATILAGVTGTSLPIQLTVASGVPPGPYSFSVMTPLGMAQSGTVQVTVAAPVSSMTMGSTHTVNVTLPNGIASQLEVYADYSLPCQ